MNYELVQALGRCIDRLERIGNELELDKDIINGAVSGDLKKEYLRAIDETKKQISEIKASIEVIKSEKEQLA